MAIDYPKWFENIRVRDADKIIQAKLKDAVDYQPETVLEAGFWRTVELYNTYDHVVIAYSGGKDSLVCLELAEMALVYLRRPDEKINVFFLDEELIPDDVINEVQKRAESGQYNLRYFCLEMAVGKYVLGKSENWVAWDKTRSDRWIRQPPDYAITDIGQDTRGLQQYDFPDLVWNDLEGSRVLVLGVRGDESLLRLRSIYSGGWINQPKQKGGLVVGKPVYDWSEQDVFKFFYDFDVPYAEIYNNQLWAGVTLRVATPLHENAIVNIGRLKAMYPNFYHQIVELFPDVEAQMRYGKSYDRERFYDIYPHTFEGCRQYVRDHCEGDEVAAKIKYIDTCEGRRLKEANPVTMTAGWPVKHVFMNVITGGYKKSGWMPLSPVPLETMEFERGHDVFN